MIKIRPVVNVNPIAYLIMLPIAILVKWLLSIAILLLKWCIGASVFLLTKLCVFAKRRLPILWHKVEKGAPALYRRCVMALDSKEGVGQSELK